jgi:nucleotide-binding universal stress UspA family protein
MQCATHILVATDMSGPATKAVSACAKLAVYVQAHVTLMTAVQMPPLGAASPFVVADSDAELERQFHAKATAELEELRRTVLSEVKAVTPLIVAHPHPASAIVESAAARRCDLIVLGTHGLTGASRFIYGSVTEKVVRHAECSVLCMTPKSDPHDVLAHHMLVATDFSEGANAACEVAAQWARHIGCTVTLFHAAPILTTTTLATGSAVAMSHVQAYQHEVEALARNRLEALGGRYFSAVPKVALKVQSAPGAAAAICERAAREIDLVVVGTHGLSGLARFLVGSVAERVVRHSPCPVLCVRQPTPA